MGRFYFILEMTEEKNLIDKKIHQGIELFTMIPDISNVKLQD